MKQIDHAGTAAKELGRTGLAPLVAWAKRAALAWARAKGLPQDDLWPQNPLTWPTVKEQDDVGAVPDPDSPAVD